MKRYRYGAEEVAQNSFTEAEIREPFRAAESSDLWITAGQALTTGVLSALFVLAAGWFSNVMDWLDWMPTGRGEILFSAAALVGVTVTLSTWLGLLREHRAGLWRAEKWINRDLDGDNVIGEPTGETVRLETINDDGEGVRAGHYANLPISRDRLETFARAVANGRGLAVSTWTGRAGMFSRSEFDQLMAYLERAGIVRWINAQAHGQGRELTRPGRVAMEQLGKR